MPKFVHLHTHSHYSLLDGLSKIDDLVARTKVLGMDAIAITDHGNLYGAIEFFKKAKAAGIKPILGVEAYIAPGSRFDRETENGKRSYHHLILLAKNKDGWKNLLALTTKASLEGFYYKPRMDKELLRQHHEGLIALSGCFGGELIQTILSGDLARAEAVARAHEEIFGKGNYFIEIGNHPNFDPKNFVIVWRELIALSKRTGIPLVATQDLHYLTREDAEYHEILLAVQTGAKLDDPERLSLKQDDYSMRSPEEMTELFKEIPEAIENTAKIADVCSVEIELGKIKLPSFPLSEGETANKALEQIISSRIKDRYPEPSAEVEKRLKMELGVIERMGFADYFLIVQDFVNWAKERGIVVGPGRGSAAGSIVSYILGITGLDPLKYELIFERFLNPERIQMPDIDIDITDIRRDEVLGYLRERYGEDHVANIITFGTMAARAAIRDVGRALGVPYSLCDQIAKLIPFHMDLEKAKAEVSDLADIYRTNDDAKRIIDAAIHLEGVARHASVHACGIVITKEPLTEYLPLQRAPQDTNIIISQFEMHAVEDLGLLKMDLLGLRNLTIIEETVRLVRELHGTNIDISKIPLDDKKAFELLKTGQTVGIFQFESGGMARNLKELKPTELEDLIAMVALYRPGPMELIPEYIARKHGEKTVMYLHPKLEAILGKTYGIMIYQEQLMKAAQVLAGFTLAEADVLRKAVGKKIRKLLLEQKEKLIQGCVKNNVSQQVAEKFWDLVEPFDRYGFNRSHAACYAMIAYQTAYLKANYPVEFMTAVLDAESGDIDRTSFIVAECKKMGIEILAPDVNRSSAVFTPEEKNIRFGLAAVKNVGTNIVDAIITERQRSGPFKDLPTFLSRVNHKDLNKKSLESLAKCGALDSLGTERNMILTNIDDIIKFNQLLKREIRTNQAGLFGAGVAPQMLRLKEAPPASPQDKLMWEKELLGLFITDHPLNRFKTKIEEAKAKPIREIVASGGRGMYAVAGVVGEIKRIVTKTGKPMIFAKIEDFDNTLEVIVFPDTLVKNQAVWRENCVVLVTGKMSSRNGEEKFICDNAIEL
ncbi:MAG: DNA polymerase III subunit alpha [Patescibacteria group bacterium]